ncbi:MAG TPA: aldehyde ferredoxin oxidoreductase C-terminal domain-containing protein [Desulfosporosinus sp.]|nr:aldehyde ferredoxin oxidoreductase C-terminal domain-containing protein [Desulfosporosinus sp.]
MGNWYFPCKNYTATGEWSPIEKIGALGNALQKIGSEHCYNCPMGCSQMKLVKKGPHAGDMSDPEFESMYSFGGQTGNDNLDSIIAADLLCDELGIDTMSAGVTIGFAMELYEKGILTPADTEGIELNFGNSEAIISLISQMSYREGLGAILADGVKVAAEKIGKGSEKYAMHIKGMELPGYDVRGAKEHGLGLATSYTGVITIVLMHSLKYYLDTESIRKAAVKSSVSVSGYKYRLTKIKELGYDLQSPQERFDLKLAIKIYEITVE